MPNLSLFITENIPNRLRGELTRWMLQLKPGVFLGTLSRLVGEKLWQKIVNNHDEGGAIWVRAKNNEQRFELTTCGTTRWNLSDYDGLQLITYPIKPKRRTIRKSESKTKSPPSQLKKESNKKEQLPEITWETGNLPADFITREVIFEQGSMTTSFNFKGNSAYYEFPPDSIWQDPWTEDIKRFGFSLVDFLTENLSQLNQLFNKRIIACLDIETTDYMPKAYEGFVNIIGISILDFNRAENEIPNLKMFQVFNMKRKKDIVPSMLDIIYPYISDVDELLVFNKDFDIKIISTVIKNYYLTYRLPDVIVDLMDFFSSLKVLEQFLSNEVGVSRKHSEKGKYSEYYKLFKGKGKDGLDKKIEPIGSYNLLDTLTPLFAYLVLNCLSKKERKN